MFDNNSKYPKPVADVTTTLIDICRHQKRTELVELLENAHAHFENTDYDNWNGGTYTWALRLEVPVHLFASLQGRLQEVEGEIGQKLDFLDRLFPNDRLSEVTITPLTSPELSRGRANAPSDTDIRRIWRDGRFRLFLSHVSRHKLQVSALKAGLVMRGISAFVAHEDIEPSLEWQNEIALALRSMDALAALITPDFHTSNWTDQEVGWALGRGIPVLPVRLAADPYGFIGKTQAVSGSMENIPALADRITQTLLRNMQTHGQMRRALVDAFEQSDSFATAKILKDFILEIDDFTDEEIESLRRACRDNYQVSHSYGVSDAIIGKFGDSNNTLALAPDEIPF